jgi:two-component system sensor histidine kinase TtrS
VQALAEPIRIGVLATRGPALARAQWQPLLRWLAQRVPGHRFVLHPLGLDELAEAVAREHLDFVITNPGQSVSLARQYPLAWLATLKSPAGETTSPSAPPWWCPPGPYRHWRDLEGKRSPPSRRTPSAATSPIASRRANRGRLERFFSTVQFTGFPLDRLIERLAAGEVAAAIVPVCQLERMEREGKVARERFGCWTIRRRPALVARARPGSTPTGPSPRQSGPPLALALAVTRALFDLPADSEAAIAADSAGWTVPTSELAIDRLLKALDRHPLQGPWWQAAGTGCASISSGAGVLWCWYCCWEATTCCCNTCSTAASAGCSKPATSSSRRDASWQARRLAELGELGANVAHEINQPLSAIANYSQGPVATGQIGTGSGQAAAQTSLRQALEQIGSRSSASPRPSTGSGPGCETPPASRLATCPPWWRSCPCWSRCWRRSTSPSPCTGGASRAGSLWMAPGWSSCWSTSSRMAPSAAKRVRAAVHSPAHP